MKMAKINARKFWGISFLAIVMAISSCKKYVPPDINWKTVPGEKYNIRLELESPSVQRLTKITGFAEYEISNFRTCMMKDRAATFGAGKYQPFQRIPLDVRQIDEKIFVTSSYKNPLVDEDYYGLGKCEWVLSSVNITLDGISGRVVTLFGGADMHPGIFKIICNEEMRLCGNKKNIPEMPARIRTSSGILIISGE